MTFFELLQAGDSSLAIVGGIVAVVFWLKTIKYKSLESQYKYVADQWTNEGDILGAAQPYIHINLVIENGEIFGSFQANEILGEYDAYFYPGWPYGKLKITQLHGRSLLPVIDFRTRLRGNNNRLEIKAIGGQSIDGIPTHATLWPVPRAARSDA